MNFKLYISIVIFLLGINSIYGQIRIVNEKIQLFDSLTVFELDDRGLISDAIYQAGQRLFIEYMFDGIKKQYFRTSDTSYYYRSYKRGRSFEKGQYIMSEEAIGVPDTSINLCSAYDEMIIEKKYPLIKNGKWFWRTSSGEEFNGTFKKGVKEGRWSKVDYRNIRTEAEYENGRIVKYIKPTSDQIDIYFDNILQSNLYAYLKDKQSLKEHLDVYGWMVKTEKYEIGRQCIIEFNSGNEITISVLNDESEKVIESITGEWSRNGEEIIFNFEGQKFIYFFSSIGENGFQILKKRKKKTSDNKR